MIRVVMRQEVLLAARVLEPETCHPGPGSDQQSDCWRRAQWQTGTMKAQAMTAQKEHETHTHDDLTEGLVT